MLQYLWHNYSVITNGEDFIHLMQSYIQERKNEHLTTILESNATGLAYNGFSYDIRMQIKDILTDY